MNNKIIVWIIHFRVRFLQAHLLWLPQWRFLNKSKSRLDRIHNYMAGKSFVFQAGGCLGYIIEWPLLPILNTYAVYALIKCYFFITVRL